jgi:hypothetical protein
MAVEGDVRVEIQAAGDPTPAGGAPNDKAEPLALQGRISGDSWLVLAGGGRLVVRDPRTGREGTFRGPGRARTCVDGQEEAWLPGGDYESSPGAGESPGAEQWVVTSAGVVRYASAKLVIEARPAAVSLAVADGTAFVWPAQDTNIAGPSTPDAEGWQRVAGGRIAFAPKARSEPREAATSAGARCSELAKEARDLAAGLLAGNRPPGAGDEAGAHPNDGPEAGASRAADQVRVRRLARAACAVAQLRARGLPDADAQSLLPILRQADSDWRALPEGARNE